jgi:hypothetical protein
MKIYLALACMAITNELLELCLRRNYTLCLNLCLGISKYKSSVDANFDVISDEVNADFHRTCN